MKTFARLVFFAVLALVAAQPAHAMLGLGVNSSAHGTSVAPTITSLSIDFASANGGESRTITGTNLALASARVDANAATITTNTSTTIVLTVPASSVSSTNGNGSASTVTVATSGGSAATSIWYLPAYFGVAKAGVWTPQNVTTSSGNIATVPDQSGNGYTLTVQSGSTAPAFSATGGGSGANKPYWSSTGTSNGALVNTSFSNSTVAIEYVFAGRMLAGGSNHLMDNNGGNICFLVWTSGTGVITQFDGASGANPVTVGANNDFHLVSLFKPIGNTTAQQILNGGSPVTGQADVGLPVSAGITVDGYGGGNGFSTANRVYFVASLPALTTTGRANYHAYLASEGF